MATKTLIALSLLIFASALALATEPAGQGTLSGVVRSHSDAPLVGARIFAGNAATGEVFPSEPTGADGTFEIPGLPPATYELAVESDQGLYLIEQPVPLAEGRRQAVGITIAPGMTAAAAAEGTAGDTAGGSSSGSGSGSAPGGGSRPNLWNNPLTAALLVLGIAIIFGLIIESATDDDDRIEDISSPMEI
jgi:hypothetical protein